MAAETTRALITRGGLAPTVEQVTLQGPRAGEIEISMRTAGICHSDLHMVNGDWAVDGALVLGHEGAGVVAALGEGVDGLEIGDHVVLNWAVGCGACGRCARGEDWLCFDSPANNNRLVTGGTAAHDATGEPMWPMLGVGAFADRVVVPAAAAVRIDTAVPFGVAALLGCSVTTGIGAVRNTAAVPSGSTAVVIGCGGVGQSIILGLGLTAPARVIALDLSPERLRIAESMGATDTVLAGPDSVEKVLDLVPEGVDFVFDAIGAPAVAGSTLAYLRPGGTAVLVGMPGGEDVITVPGFDFVASGKTLLGCNYGSSTPSVDIPAYADLYLRGELDLDALVGAPIPLDAAAEAILALPRAVGARTIVEFA